MKAEIWIGGLGLVAIGAGSALFVARRDNQELADRNARLARQNAELRYELKLATNLAGDIGRRAIELDSQLGSTKARTTAAAAKSFQLARELDETRSLLSEREQREIALLAELATLRRKVAEAAPSSSSVLAGSGKAEGAVAVTGGPSVPAVPPPTLDVAAYLRRIEELERQLPDLLTRALAQPPPSPDAAPATHQVVRVGPADAFVVLDYGAEHGARPNAVISLQRGTSELAQVQISDVRSRFSLAQVLSGTLKGQLQTGDLIVFKP